MGDDRDPNAVSREEESSRLPGLDAKMGDDWALARFWNPAALVGVVVVSSGSQGGWVGWGFRMALFRGTSLLWLGVASVGE